MSPGRPGPVRENPRHHWVERLYISTIVKFESDSIKTNEDIAPQSREILQDVCLVGGTNLPPPPPPPSPTTYSRYQRGFFRRY